MTQDEIIEMGKQSGIDLYARGKGRANFVHYLERFAKLVAAKEREACAKVCEDFDSEISDCCANAIRARGEA